MIVNGIEKVKRDPRDYDHLKTFGSEGVMTLPETYNSDAGLWMPDQNAMALPYGCTGFAQGDLCADEDSIIYDPGFIYRATPTIGDPAGGRNIRTSLSTICKNDIKQYLNNIVKDSHRTAYFSIKSQGMLDWFDAIRVSMYSASNEKRSVSIAIPWFPEFNHPTNGIVPPPPMYKWYAWVPGHNAKIGGWKVIGNETFLTVKPWQGEGVGDGGWLYFSRPIINALFKMDGTGAFTVTKVRPGQVQTVDMNIVESIVGFIRSLLGL